MNKKNKLLMNINGHYLKLIFVFVMSGFTSVVSADDYRERLHFGFSYGSTDIDLLRGSKQEGSAKTVITADTSSQSLQAILGYRYNPFFNVEFTYLNVTAFDHNIEASFPVKQIKANVKTDLSYQGISLNLRPKYNFGEYFSVQGLAGFGYVQGKRSSSVNWTGAHDAADLQELNKISEQTIKSANDAQVSLIYGAGFQYYISKRWALRYDYIIADHNADTLVSQQIGLTRKFRKLPFFPEKK